MKKGNQKILILIGIPASGKSTWAKDFVRNNPDYVRVNRDDFRDMLKSSQTCENKIEDMITSLVFGVIEEALSKRLNIIVDNTNLKQKYINEIIEKFKYSADIDYRVFDISLKKALEYNAGRERKVPESVIEKMFKSYKQLIDGFDFTSITKIEKRPVIIPDFGNRLRNAVIFDIDGTLALMGNRGPFDWDKVHKDEVNEIVAEQIKFHQTQSREILLVSGRDESCRKDTEDWLGMYGIHFDKLFMRPKDDFRKDTIIKKEIYDNDIVGEYNVLCVYDDRLQVLDMWFEKEIFAFNVNQGNFKF